MVKKANTIQIQENFTKVGAKAIDNRNRIPIGDAIKRERTSDHYMLFANRETGDILLRPLAQIPEAELWLYKNKKAFDSVMRGLEQFAKGQVQPLDESLLAPEE